MGAGIWWETTTALKSSEAVGNAAFDIVEGGGHGSTCKIRCRKAPSQ